MFRQYYVQLWFQPVGFWLLLGQNKYIALRQRHAKGTWLLERDQGGSLKQPGGAYEPSHSSVAILKMYKRICLLTWSDDVIPPSVFQANWALYLWLSFNPQHVQTAVKMTEFSHLWNCFTSMLCVSNENVEQPRDLYINVLFAEVIMTFHAISTVN